MTQIQHGLSYEVITTGKDWSQQCHSKKHSKSWLPSPHFWCCVSNPPHLGLCKAGITPKASSGYPWPMPAGAQLGNSSLCGGPPGCIANRLGKWGVGDRCVRVTCNERSVRQHMAYCSSPPHTIIVRILSILPLGF